MRINARVKETTPVREIELDGAICVNIFGKLWNDRWISCIEVFHRQDRGCHVAEAEVIRFILGERGACAVPSGQGKGNESIKRAPSVSLDQRVRKLANAKHEQQAQ